MDIVSFAMLSFAAESREIHSVMTTPAETDLARLPLSRSALQELLSRFWALPSLDQYKLAVTLWFGVFCAGFMLLPAEAEQRWLFYIGIPVCLPAVAHAWRWLARGPLVWALAAFLGYSGVSALWSDNWLTVGDELRRAFWIGYFLLACCAIGEFGLPRLRRVLQAVLIFAAAVAVYQVASFFLTCVDCSRFPGFGAHAKSTWTAMIAGAIALLGLSASFTSARVPSLALLACQGPLCALLITTGSRGAVVGYFGSLLLVVALMLRRSNKGQAVRAVAAMLGCIGIAVGFVAVLGRAWLHSEIARGDSMRFQLWSVNLQRIAKHPWFGHGATTRDLVAMANGDIGTHAHNLFLAQTFYGGAVGCALWLAVLVLALRVGWRAFQTSGELLPLVPLAFLLVISEVDIGPVLVDVQPEWLFVWVVLGVTLAYDTDLRRRAITSR